MNELIMFVAVYFAASAALIGCIHFGVLSALRVWDRERKP